MVFHMAARAIGRENFLAGLRQVAAEHHYTKAAWSDFLTAFGAVSGRDLTQFSEQWLTWTGAPVLDLGPVAFEKDKVVFTLEQGEPAYHLEVPVVLTTGEGEQEHMVVFDGATATFELEAEEVTGLAVDPDCHLFRQLHSQEIEPTISQVLAEEEPVFFAAEGPGDLVEAAREFAAGFSEQDDFLFVEDGSLPAGGHAAVVFNPGAALLKQFLPPELVVSGSTVFLGGKRYSLKEYDLVFAAADPNEPGLTDLVVLCDSTFRLEALASRVGHYGKYSWLLLPTGQGRPLRGNWAAGQSPLVAVR